MRCLPSPAWLLVVLVSVTASACNDVGGEVDAALEADPRNAVVDVNASYAGLFDHSSLVLEVEQPAPTAAPADLFRALLQSADALKDRTFETVELHGPAGHVYTLDGSYFKTLGTEYDFQNPVYSMRTFPYELKRPDGAQAFYASGGGLFGLGSQFEDFGEAMRAWSM